MAALVGGTDLPLRHGSPLDWLQRRIDVGLWRMTGRTDGCATAPRQRHVGLVRPNFGGGSDEDDDTAQDYHEDEGEGRVSAGGY